MTEKERQTDRQTDRLRGRETWKKNVLIEHQYKNRVYHSQEHSGLKRREMLWSRIRERKETYRQT